MNYKEALAWLYGLQRFGIKLGLENIQRVLAALTGKGDFQIASGGLEAAAPCFGKVIHVAGTNGKGSTCAMIDSIARAKNLRTGLFTSPHLVTFRERIRINGKMITEKAVASGLTRIRDLVSSWDPHPTFFEITTALALMHFSQAKLALAVLETGLGGRLDATNAVPSAVSVITSIELDHEKWLGPTLREIAIEKAGIIKSKVPVISAPQHPDVTVVIRARAAGCAAPLQFVSEPYDQSPIALRGVHQKQNAALAIAALQAAGIDVDKSAIAKGLAKVDWPARFQPWDERTIIDGAHNPSAARVLAQTWQETFGQQRATLILAILNDKNLRGICEALAPITGLVLLPRIRSERAAEREALAKTATDLALKNEVCETIPDALKKARSRSGPILITGSLHFAGEALAHLQGKPGAFEECAQ